MLSELQTTSQKMQMLLNEISAEAEAFGVAAGLKCPAGCGHCCDNPNIEASVLEMLPMATALIESRESEAVLKQLAQKVAESSNICIAFRAQNGKQGRCARYEHRPSICRLFGYSARRNRMGQREMVACRIHKESSAPTVHLAQELLNDSRTEAPLYGAWATKLCELDPHLGYRLMPLNQALEIALEKVTMAKAYGDVEGILQENGEALH
jgi:Fe-S-cluster containining protein